MTTKIKPSTSNQQQSVFTYTLALLLFPAIMYYVLLAALNRQGNLSENFGINAMLIIVPVIVFAIAFYTLRNTLYIWDNSRYIGVLLLVPSVLFILALVGFPFLLAIAFSFSDVTVGDTSLNYTGFSNFVSIWKNDDFRQALWQTIFFTVVSQIFIIILANVLAILFTQDFKGKWFARFLFIMPWSTPVSLAVVGWLWFLDNKYSPLDYLLRDMGVSGPNSLMHQYFDTTNFHINWLGTPNLAQIAVIMIQVWRLTPLATVILMAGFSSIPDDILDQAKVDGARFFRTLFKIKIPLIMPILIISMLFSMITMFGDMTLVFVLTRGGPVDYTRVLGLYSYQVGIEGGNLAQGAAMALFMFPLLLALAIFMLRSASRSEVI